MHPLQLLHSALFNISEFFLRCFLRAVHQLLGPFIPKESDKDQWMYLWLKWTLFLPVTVTAISSLSCPALIAFCLKNILHQFRLSYILSIRNCSYDNDNSFIQSDSNVSNTGNIFSAVTSNVCLIPGIGSTFNNLSDPVTRARVIGEEIFIDQQYYRSMMSHLQKCNRYTNNNSRLTNEAITDDQENNRHLQPSASVLTRFPHADFVCFQEVYDRDSAKVLVKELHKFYPWVVYDVGQWGLGINKFGFNSGLVVASKHKILEVDFKPFKVKKGVFKFASAGLLMVKVLLGRDNKDPSKKKVGFIFNTHLQPFQGSDPIIDQQMSDILLWTSEFRKRLVQTEEIILFDILCGDFNADNMSPGEVHLSHHELFKVYTDVARVCPGKDQPWAIGTEMRVPVLSDDLVITPEGLRSVLEDPYLRQQYILDADQESATIQSIYRSSVKTDAQGNPVLSPVGGKRRIDVVLYRKENPLIVEHYNFITRLANMTDHIPVSMTFRCH